MKVLIVGHGDYAKGLKSCIGQLTNLNEEIISIDYEKNQSFEQFEHRTRNELKLHKEILVFIDIVGGATFKAVSKMIVEEDELNKFIIGGVSVSCVLEIIMNTVLIKEYSDIRRKIDKAIKNASETTVVLDKGAISYE
ncbi:MAG: hypothetical protein ACRDAU_07405 [Clostridium sp.]